MFFEKKSTNTLNIICNLGVLGFMFLFGGMYTYVYFHGTLLLEACIIMFIGSTLLVIQYRFLRHLNFKERIPEVLIILLANIFSVFIFEQNVILVAIILLISNTACVLINRKKIDKFEKIYM